MAAIKLFYSIRENFQAIGFHAPPTPDQNCTFNGKNVFYIFSQVGMVVLTMGFLLFKATSAVEYTVCFYLSIAMTTIIVYCAVLFIQMGSIVMLIEKYKKFIENREFIFEH